MSYIESHEGVHYSLIKKALNLKNGTLSYHLHLLEKEGVIFSKKIGKYRVFYVKDFRKPYLTDIQKRILSLVEERGEISLGALRNEIDISRQLLSYHIKILNNFGYLGKKKKGKEVYIYIREKY